MFFQGLHLQQDTHSAPRLAQLAVVPARLHRLDRSHPRDQPAVRPLEVRDPESPRPQNPHLQEAVPRAALPV